MIMVRGFDRVTGKPCKRLRYSDVQKFNKTFIGQVMERWLSYLNIKVFVINKIGEEIEIGQFNEEDYHTALTQLIINDKYIEYGENQDLKETK